MIFFSNEYFEDQSIISNHHFNRHFDYEELTKRITSIIKEIVTYNSLTTKEAIKILKIYNAEPLRCFSNCDIRRFFISK